MTKPPHATTPHPFRLSRELVNDSAKAQLDAIKHVGRRLRECSAVVDIAEHFDEEEVDEAFLDADQALFEACRKVEHLVRQLAARAAACPSCGMHARCRDDHEEGCPILDDVKALGSAMQQAATEAASGGGLIPTEAAVTKDELERAAPAIPRTTYAEGAGPCAHCGLGRDPYNHLASCPALARS